MNALTIKNLIDHALFGCAKTNNGPIFQPSLTTDQAFETVAE